MEQVSSRDGAGIFGKVLVTTDFSGPAQNTLACVSGMQGLTEMVLYHAIDGTRPFRNESLYNQKIEKARTLLGEKQRQLGGRGFRVETRVKAVIRGDIATSILETAEEEHVTLVIMGSRGRTLVNGLLLGSVSSDVVRSGRIPLLVLNYEFAESLREKDCRRRCGEILSRVLVATDFSPAADHCTRFLAGTPGIGELVLLHVAPKGGTPEETGGRVSEATAKLEGIAAEFRALGHRVSPRVHVGDPVGEILRVARVEDPTVIAMGTVGKNWLTEILFGSTTLGVIRHANLPVLVIRTPHDAPGEGGKARGDRLLLSKR
jgi:nucleotide-binding universal stress UspA family protein